MTLNDLELGDEKTLSGGDAHLPNFKMCASQKVFNSASDVGMLCKQKYRAN